MRTPLEEDPLAALYEVVEVDTALVLKLLDFGTEAVELEKAGLKLLEERLLETELALETMLLLLELDTELSDELLEVTEDPPDELLEELDELDSDEQTDSSS